MEIGVNRVRFFAAVLGVIAVGIFGKTLISSSAALHPAHTCIQANVTPDKTIASCTRALDLGPSDQNTKDAILYARAKAFVDREMYSEAAKDLDAILATTPDLMLVNLLQGFVLYKLSDYDGSASQFERVTAKAPENEDAQLRLIASLAAAKRYDAALARLDTLSSDFPEIGWLELKYGDVFSEMGENAQALTSYLKAVTRRPNDRKAFSGLLLTCRKELEKGNPCPSLDFPSVEEKSCSDALEQFTAAYAAGELFQEDPNAARKMDLTGQNDGSYILLTNWFLHFRSKFETIKSRADFAALGLLPRLIECSEPAYLRSEKFQPYIPNEFNRLFPKEILNYYSEFAQNLAVMPAE